MCFQIPDSILVLSSVVWIYSLLLFLEGKASFFFLPFHRKCFSHITHWTNNTTMGFVGGEGSNNVSDSMDFEVSQQVPGTSLSFPIFSLRLCVSLFHTLPQHIAHFSLCYVSLHFKFKHSSWASVLLMDEITSYVIIVMHF